MTCAHFSQAPSVNLKLRVNHVACTFQEVQSYEPPDFICRPAYMRLNAAIDNICPAGACRRGNFHERRNLAACGLQVKIACESMKRSFTYASREIQTSGYTIMNAQSRSEQG